jgi:hypothetical protein
MKTTAAVLRIAAFTGCLAIYAGSASAQSSYAEDRAEIQNLQARYMFALDFRDGTEYASTFTEDGIFDYTAGKIRGREAIAAFINNMRGGAEQSSR